MLTSTSVVSTSVANVEEGKKFTYQYRFCHLEVMSGQRRIKDGKALNNTFHWKCSWIFYSLLLMMFYKMLGQQLCWPDRTKSVFVVYPM